MAHLVEIERFETKVAGADEISPAALRVTSVFRRGDDGWKLLHRHADRITPPCSGESILQS
jgi:ketosteroid isomerase-like protein